MKDLTVAELLIFKKLSVNLDMIKSNVSIAFVAIETINFCKTNNFDYNIREIVSLIRSNRETSTTEKIEKMVAFNPELKVVGTNARLFPLFYHQFVNLKYELYMPEIENVIPTFIPEIENAIPAKTKKAKKA